MSRRTEKNVGVIGLGIIGQRVADSVRRRGYHVFVWNRTPRPFPNFVGSPAEVAELCDYIQIFVSDDEALLEMIQQMKQSLKSHHVILAHSTVAPSTMRAAAEIVQRRGAQFLDAPFTGSKGAAEKGELVYYIGGDEAAYRRARPILQASSKEIIEIGEIGQATTIKVATNMITAATVQAAAEALALVHHAGLPLEKFATAMHGNGSNSGTLAMKLPKMLEGNFDPHFSVKHMLKDTQIASRLARSYDLPLPATEVARDSLIEEVRQGRADYDYSSVVQLFFPDGMPGKFEIAAEPEGAHQTTLSGLEHAEVPSAPREPEPEPIAEPVSISEENRGASEAAEAVEMTEHVPAETPPTELNGEARSEEVGAENERGLPKETPASQISAEEKPATEKAVAAENQAEQPRGFLSRLFGKGVDY
ncbi:MAG: NAD(P)-dependent oxidoreductase [Chthoniobacterales bacterium]